MKILQLCKKYPFPLKDGEAIAVTNLSRAMHKQGCEVHLLTMNTAKHYYPDRGKPDALRQYASITAVEVDNRVRPWGAFLNLFSRDSYHVTRYVSADFRQALRRLLRSEQFDLIQLETLYLAPYIPDIRELSSARLVMRAHNVESEIWKRLTHHSSPGLRKRYLRHLTRKLEAYERNQLENYDLLLPITERDADTFRELGHTGTQIVTPIGIDPDAYRPDFGSYARPLSLGFIGSLDWMPNREGLDWFLKEVWPPLRKVFPGLELHIAGRHTPSRLKKLRLPGVVVHGEVDNASEFINRHSIMLVPLRSGSGMRAKILEGMALGKVVLTTTLGLEGIPATDRDEVLVADDPDAFVRAVAHCQNQNGQFRGMGDLARAFVARHYENDTIARRLLDALFELESETQKP